ncbi:MAG TPA: DUF302 domain-containing protein [Thiobacillaceae bacterium]|nr:DUF302 domain-containing protein [Thiobacillaceae bacterium]
MKRSLFILQAWLLGLAVVLATPALAGDVQKHGGAFYIRLPATIDFAQVVDRLQTEIQAKNWEVLKVQDVDKGLKDNYHVDVQNKVIYACKSQYLARAIKEDPNITLIVPCRFAVYRVDASGKAVGGKPGKVGKIVVGISDPADEARHLGIKQMGAAKAASKELQEVLQAVADDYLRMK